MSSTQVARCGSQSLTGIPDAPCGRNRRRLAKSVLPPVPIGVMTVPKLAGRRWPWPRQFGLGIPRIDRAGPTFHEEEDDGTCSGRKMRRPRGERVGDRLGRVAARQEAVAREHGAQGEGAETAASFQEKVAAGGEERDVRGVHGESSSD